MATTFYINRDAETETDTSKINLKQTDIYINTHTHTDTPHTYRHIQYFIERARRVRPI